MTGAAVRTLDRADAVAVLEDRRTGVLALARDDAAYAIPVAYTYDDESNAVYLRLGYGPESTKRAYVESVEKATLVVYGETEDGWVSVLVRGPLEELSSLKELRHRHPRGESSQSLEAAVTNLEIPFFRVFDADADLEFVVARLDAPEVTGVETE